MNRKTGRSLFSLYQTACKTQAFFCPGQECACAGWKQDKSGVNDVRNTKRIAAAWVMCLLWMGMIFAMSVMPGDVSGDQSGRLTQVLMAVMKAVFGSAAAAISPQTLELLVRKGAHMAEYAVLFVLYRRALRLSGAKRPGAAALVMCMVYAATDEFHQSFVDDRGPSPVDVMIDTAGAAAAWALTAMSERLRRTPFIKKDALH